MRVDRLFVGRFFLRSICKRAPVRPPRIAVDAGKGMGNLDRFAAAHRQYKELRDEFFFWMVRGERSRDKCDSIAGLRPCRISDVVAIARYNGLRACRDIDEYEFAAVAVLI